MVLSYGLGNLWLEVSLFSTTCGNSGTDELWLHLRLTATAKELVLDD